MICSHHSSFYATLVFVERVSSKYVMVNSIFATAIVGHSVAESRYILYEECVLGNKGINIKSWNIE